MPESSARMNESVQTSAKSASDEVSIYKPRGSSMPSQVLPNPEHIAVLDQGECGLTRATPTEQLPGSCFFINALRWRRATTSRRLRTFNQRSSANPLENRCAERRRSNL